MRQPDPISYCSTFKQFVKTFISEFFGRELREGGGEIGWRMVTALIIMVGKSGKCREKNCFSPLTVFATLKINKNCRNIQHTYNIQFLPKNLFLINWIKSNLERKHVLLKKVWNCLKYEFLRLKMCIIFCLMAIPNVFGVGCNVFVFGAKKLSVLDSVPKTLVCEFYYDSVRL